MFFQPRSTAHEGTPPAAAMPTPFSFPCGKNFLHEQFQQNKEMRDKCAPPGFEEYWWQNVGYYSPAICPSGYTAGCFRWNTDQGPPVEATETAVQCVPAGYQCHTDDISNAVSYSATAPMIQVRWASTDLPDFATHPLYPGVNPTDNNLQGEMVGPTADANILAARAASSGFFDSPDLSSVFGSSIPTDGFTATLPLDDPSNTGDNGFPQFTNTGGQKLAQDAISTGTKIGIGVGVSMGVMMLLAIGGFIFWRWRRKRKLNDLSLAGPEPDAPPPAWTQQPQMTSHGFKHELGSTGSPTAVGSSVAAPSPAMMSRTDNATPQAELSGNNYQQGSAGWPAELHNQPSQQYPHQQHNELSGASAYRGATEMDSNQQPSPGNVPVQYPPSTYQTPSPGQPQVASPIAPPPASTPPADAVHTDVAATAGPSAEEMQQQHAQLEERRQRLLELERIHQEQAELQARMKAGQGQS